MNQEQANSMYTGDTTSHNKQSMHNQAYGKLLLMTVLSFIAMYLFMYSMIDSLPNFYNNVNQFYMAGLMAMPMVIFEVIIMRKMYMNKRWNAIIIAGSAILLVLFFLFIRQQTGVSDKQFVRGMIPHHASAILMSKKSHVTDPELLKLQQEIISSQEREIAQMKAILERLNK